MLLILAKPAISIPPATVLQLLGDALLNPVSVSLKKKAPGRVTEPSTKPNAVPVKGCLTQLLSATAS